MTENQEIKKDAVEMEIKIDDRIVSLLEFQNIRRDPSIRLTEISHNTYKTLQRMFG